MTTRQADMRISVAELVEIATGAIRSEARRRQVSILTKDDAHRVWDDLARTEPDLWASQFYRLASDRHIKRVLNLVLREGRG